MLVVTVTRSMVSRIGLFTIAICTFAIINSNPVARMLGAQTLKQSGPNQRVEGRVPDNWHPGTGTIITGDAAEKASGAALSKYPGGTVNRVLKLSDGSYAVHMIKIRWPHHVFVDKKFEVTGAIG